MLIRYKEWQNVPLQEQELLYTLFIVIYKALRIITGLHLLDKYLMNKLQCGEVVQNSLAE